MTEPVTDIYLDHLRQALQDRASLLGDRKWEMFKEAVHTGHLNALHQVSPACSKTFAEADYWFDVGLAYIKFWDRMHPVKGEGSP